MQVSRRSFLGVAMGAAAPGLFGRAAWSALDASQPGGKPTVLVIVQLSGGNDGLNTVVPFRDEAYQKARPKLKHTASTVLKINQEVGFHPQAKGFAELLQDNALAVVQGVGYPQPNRSHFESMDIWHKATASKDEHYGWLGRALPQLGTNGQALQIGEGNPVLALQGTSGSAPKLESIRDYQLRVAANGDDRAKRQAIEQLAVRTTANPLTDLVRQAARETYRSAEQLRKIGEKYDTSVAYPQTGLGQRLKLIAQLISAGVSERIYYTSIDGFDTHAEQIPLHNRLMQEVSEAMAAFQKDLKEHGEADRVLTFSFSEFGRRVAENASGGTDHGAAGPVFVMGSRVRPGTLGAIPSLTDLDDGDLKFHTDFRSLYATLLDQWIGIPSQSILGVAYPKLELLKG